MASVETIRRTAEELNSAAMGARVRAIRQKMNLSTNELALRAGLSTGLISQIERGQANPSLRTLERLRFALSVSLMVLLEPPNRGEAEPVFVRRSHARPRIVVGNNGVGKEILSPADTEGLRFMIVRVPPGSRSEEMVIGPGQKAGLVLSGAIRLSVGDEEARLAEGDSFQFGSDVQHAFANDTDRPAEILWIMLEGAR